MRNKKILKKAFIDTLPIMAGYLVLGIGFGILLASKGYNIFVAILMSLIIYGGSMQYLGVELLAGGASILATAILTLMVHTRFVFYGVSMVDKFKKLNKLKYYTIFTLSDETYSLICNADIDEKDRGEYYFLVALLNQIYWVIGSALGSGIGTFIKFNTKGVDFAMTALFVTILVGQWQNTKEHKYAIIGLIVSIIALLIFGANNFLIPAMLGILLVLRYFYKKENGNGQA